MRMKKQLSLQRWLTVAAVGLLSSASVQGIILECKDVSDIYNNWLVPSTSMRGLCKVPAYSDYLANLNKTADGDNNGTAVEMATEKAEKQVAPSYNWGFHLGDYWEVPETAGHSGAFHVFPDSHMPAVPHPDGGWVLFWANSENWRSRGPSPYIEQQQFYEPWGMMYGGRTWRWGYDNGGKWLMSVNPHPTDGNPRHLVGFYHAEDGFWPYQGAGGPAWKAIGVTHSWDAGITWHDYGPIITSNTARPEDWRPYYGGVGNFNAAWDSANSRWVMYFAEYWIGMAVSSDPNGMPQTFWKWNGYDRGFSEPGWGGVYQPLPGLSNVPGGNPSISWNTYLNKWVMIYSGWDFQLHISASYDGITWDGVRTLTGSVDGSRAWYPTLMSDFGPYISFKDTTLYYADRFQYPDIRKVVKRQLSFTRYD